MHSARPRFRILNHRTSTRVSDSVPRRSPLSSSSDPLRAHRLLHDVGTLARSSALRLWMRSHATLLLMFVVATLGAGCVSSAPANRLRADDAGVAIAYPPAVPAGAVQIEAVQSASRIPSARSPSSELAKRGSQARSTAELALADRRYMVTQPPPLPSSAPRHLKPLRPAREAVWIDGYWAYTGNAGSPYEWMAGHWEIPPPGAQSWVPSGWHHTGNNYIYVRGQWR
jgi:hypothetical protein